MGLIRNSPDCQPETAARPRQRRRGPNPAQQRRDHQRQTDCEHRERQAPVLQPVNTPTLLGQPPTSSMLTLKPLLGGSGKFLNSSPIWGQTHCHRKLFYHSIWHGKEISNSLLRFILFFEIVASDSWRVLQTYCKTYSNVIERHTVIEIDLPMIQYNMRNGDDPFLPLSIGIVKKKNRLFLLKWPTPTDYWCLIC